MASSRLRFAAGDLADLSGVPAVLSELLADEKQLDLVILNAGIAATIDRFEMLPIEDLQRVFTVNVLANKAVLDFLLVNKFALKQVIAISSGSSVNGSAGYGTYSVSKAALNMLIKTYATENQAVYFTAVAPGLVRTPLTGQLLAVPKEKGFPAIERLRAAASGEGLQEPRVAAARILGLLERFKEFASGSYIDIRNI
jgi:alcohol dehydrogenase